MDWHLAYIALGSNLGDRKAAIVQAVDLLIRTPGMRLRELSSLYETAPEEVPEESPQDFLNGVLLVETTLEPVTLMERLREIERRMGRPEERVRNASRMIDLDLLLYDDLILDTPELNLPHPRMHERRFVLDPLAEVAPDLVHPVLKETIQTLQKRL